MPDSCSDWTDILEDGTIVLPLSVHVMSAAGKLPLWMQNSCSGSPSSTVVELGLTRKESRIAELKKKIHEMCILPIKPAIHELSGV